ncbi:transposase [Micromonospora sp. STR1s_5]|nr:transposase [Micromonospora sp. STR1s_5]
MAQVKVLSVESLRRWSRSETERTVSASLKRGVSASEVARSASNHVSQLFRWRKQVCERMAPSAPALIPVAVVPDPPCTPPAPAFARSPLRCDYEGATKSLLSYVRCSPGVSVVQW